jgi:broad specificity phosphatase PhoE
MDGTAPAPPYLLRYRERRAGTAAASPPPLHLRRCTHAPAAPVATNGPEIPDGPDAGAAVELHLVRHGETQSYLADAGLTPRGAWQSRRWGLGLAAEIRQGEIVRLLCAPTARAARTADHVRLGLEDGLAARGQTAVVLDPEPAEQFRNFQLDTPAGRLDPTVAAGTYRSTLGGHEHALWRLELSRFWRLQSGGGDPIELWLTNPLLTFEPPAAVVRRFWAGALALAGTGAGHTRVVCCTHSGPMRAFAAWALGHDAGEPHNTEQVRVRIRPGTRRALVTYRGRTEEIDDG